MKKLSLLTIVMLFITVALAAQQKEVVKFDETTHDYGTVKEEDGRVSATFKFQNIATTPIFIKTVRASCGCTTPSWSKAPIEPNDSGYINVTYNASGRPGHFQKSITVTYSDGTEDTRKVLFIKGKVTPRQPKPVAVETKEAQATK